MNINPKFERLIRLQKASPEFENRPHISTLHRWRMRGVRGVKLETILIGNTRFTSAEAISRFLTRLNSGEPPAPEITESQRLRESEVAREELRKRGI